MDFKSILFGSDLILYSKQTSLVTVLSNTIHTKNVWIATLYYSYIWHVGLSTPHVKCMNSTTIFERTVTSEVFFPDLGSALPDLGSALPDLSSALPDLGNALPDLGSALPKSGNALHKSGNALKDGKHF